jgi:D-serine deaminase-like pyridoxal phosphate-dependent protein
MVDTPSLIIDKSKMMKNIAQMQSVATQNRVNLRPHVKTHKIPAIAKMQIEAGATGITVAKVSEAEVMAEGGIDDIFIAYPIVTEAKIKRVIELSRKIDLTVGVDSLVGAEKLSVFAAKHGSTIKVRLEVDTGLKRTGVIYDDAIELARKIHSLTNLDLTGIYTFRGAIFKGKPTLDLEEAGREEGELMVSLAERLRESGIEIKDVSVGSSPTARFAARVKGITEIRPGTYVFYDRMQAKLNVCEMEECSAKVVATIVSMPSKDLCIIDGGSKTFATDVQPNTDPLNLEGFGYIVNCPEAILERVTEEHGMVKVPNDHSFKIGDTIEIIPNHICPTVNLHNDVYLVEEDGSIEKSPVLARGKLY